MKKITSNVLLSLLLSVITVAHGQASINRERAEAMDGLNRIRALMGLGYVHQQLDLKKVALKHALFGVKNAGKSQVDAHHQAFLRNYFSGNDLVERMRQTAFEPVIPDPVNGGDFLCEVISPSSKNHKDAIKHLLDAPYHRSCLLDMHVVQMGFGCSVHQHDSSRYCVGDLYGIGMGSFSKLTGLEFADMLLGSESCVTGKTCPSVHSNKQKQFVPLLEANLKVSQSVNRIDKRVLAGFEPLQDDLSLIHAKQYWLSENGIHIEAPAEKPKLDCTENSDLLACQEFWDNYSSSIAMSDHHTVLHYAHEIHERVGKEIQTNLRQWPDMTYFPFDGSGHPVPTAFARHFEKPSPLPVGLEVSGYPISIYFSPLFNKVLVDDFQLLDARGNKIATLQIDRDLDTNYSDDGNGRANSPTSYHSYIFLPIDVLKAGQTYTVKVQYRTKAAIDRKWSGQNAHSWTFTTARGETIAEGDFPENVGPCLTANHRAAACLASAERERAGCIEKIANYHRTCEQLHDRRTARWMTAEEAADDLARVDEEPEYVEESIDSDF